MRLPVVPPRPLRQHPALLPRWRRRGRLASGLGARREAPAPRPWRLTAQRAAALAWFATPLILPLTHSGSPRYRPLRPSAWSGRGIGFSRRFNL